MQIKREIFAQNVVPDWMKKHGLCPECDKSRLKKSKPEEKTQTYYNSVFADRWHNRVVIIGLDHFKVTDNTLTNIISDQQKISYGQ